MENHPCRLTYAAQPSFSSATSHVNDLDLMLEALKKAAEVL